jgi:hypothetical protein
MENKAYFDEKRGCIVIELAKIDKTASVISESGKSYKVGNLSEKITMGDKVVTVGVNAFVTIPKANRK